MYGIKSKNKFFFFPKSTPFEKKKKTLNIDSFMIELVRATRVRHVFIMEKKIVIKINSIFYLQNKNINHLILKIQ